MKKLIALVIAVVFTVPVFAGEYSDNKKTEELIKLNIAFVTTATTLPSKYGKNALDTCHKQGLKSATLPFIQCIHSYIKASEVNYQAIKK